MDSKRFDGKSIDSVIPSNSGDLTLARLQQPKLEASSFSSTNPSLNKMANNSFVMKNLRDKNSVPAARDNHVRPSFNSFLKDALPVKDLFSQLGFGASKS